MLALLVGPVGAAVAQAAGYAGQALAENTRRAYAADWRAFAAWCAAGGAPTLPAAPLVIAGHLASLAGRLGRSGLVMHHTRQKSLATTQGYRRRAKITADSPARLLDL